MEKMSHVKGNQEISGVIILSHEMAFKSIVTLKDKEEHYIFILKMSICREDETFLHLQAANGSARPLNVSPEGRNEAWLTLSCSRDFFCLVPTVPSK